MLEEIRHIKNSRKDLRLFGITVGLVLAGLGIVSFSRGRVDATPYLFIVSAALFVFGLVSPGRLKGIHKAWMTAALLIGWVMTRVILSILFFLVMTPIGFLGRLFGERFLDLSFDRKAQSYWITKQETPCRQKDYERQF